MKKNIDKRSENNCYGCLACKQICPKNAITTKEDDKGFVIPIIDYKKCIDCGLCKTVCPYDNKTGSNNFKKVFAARLNDKNYITKSSSGGVFFALATKIIDDNGYVAGVTIDSNHEVEYILINEHKDLKKIMKSKYVQASTKYIFKEIHEVLKNNYKVLFAGTACQIAGLKLYLKKEYENLYLVELVCHGVPSPGLFKRYLEWIEKKEGKKIISYTFRNKDKKKSGEHSTIKIKFDNNEIKHLYSYEDPYYSSFLDGKTLRETCYKCQFKGKKRVADITLCDYWGIEKIIKKFPAQRGASGILINTNKGIQIFSEIKENLFTIESDFESLSQNNQSILKCPQKEKKLDYNINEEKLFEKLTPKRTLIEKIKYRIPSSIKYYLKRIK